MLSVCSWSSERVRVSAETWKRSLGVAQHRVGGRLCRGGDTPKSSTKPDCTDPLRGSGTQRSACEAAERGPVRGKEDPKGGRVGLVEPRTGSVLSEVPGCACVHDAGGGQLVGNGPAWGKLALDDSRTAMKVTSWLRACKLYWFGVAKRSSGMLYSEEYPEYPWKRAEQRGVSIGVEARSTQNVVRRHECYRGTAQAPRVGPASL